MNAPNKPVAKSAIETSYMLLPFFRYLPQNKLAEYRKDNEPIVCPIFRHCTDDWVVDHCHYSGCVRGVISREANSMLGKAENFFRSRGKNAACTLPQALRFMADYLERERTGILHCTGATQIAKRFGRLPKDEQERILAKLGLPVADITKLRNSTQRKQQFRDIITGKWNGKNNAS